MRQVNLVESVYNQLSAACLLYKEARYSEALAKYTTAQQLVGYDAHLSYNIALCHYRLKDFAQALKHIADIIERGIREHPELSVGMQTEGIEVGDVCLCLSAPLLV